MEASDAKGLRELQVMFTGETLGLAVLLCVGALGGKAIACWGRRVSARIRSAREGDDVRADRAAGRRDARRDVDRFEIGLFGTSLVNAAALVLILVSIVVAALLAQRSVR